MTYRITYRHTVNGITSIMSEDLDGSLFEEDCTDDKIIEEYMNILVDEMLQQKPEIKNAEYCSFTKGMSVVTEIHKFGHGFEKYSVDDCFEVTKLN